MFTKHKFILLSGAGMLAVALTGCNASEGGHSAVSEAPTANAAAKSTNLATYTPEQGATLLTTCNIEAFDSTRFSAQPIEAKFAETHTITGWVAPPSATAMKYWIRFDDKESNQYFHEAINPSLERLDVVAVSGNESLPLNSGFKVDLPTNALPAGNYHVYLAAVAGKTVYSCDSGRQVSLAD